MSPGLHAAALGSEDSAQMLLGEMSCVYNYPPHPTPPPHHTARAPRDTIISIIKYILISRRVTHHLRALNIFVIHRRRSSAFAKTTSNKKTRRTPQKTGTALKSHLHCVELKKRKNAYDSEISGSRRFSKKNMSQKHAKQRVSRGYAILTHSLK